MLLLLFELGRDRYALDAGQVSEILPLVRIKHLPHAPAGVAGVIDFRGVPVPVIDLSLLTLGRPALPRLSTRLVIVRYPDGHGGVKLLGLIAERATETIRRDRADFVESGVTNGNVPYLGPVAADRRGLLQLIDVTSLLPGSIRDVLLRDSPDQQRHSPASRPS